MRAVHDSAFWCPCESTVAGAIPGDVIPQLTWRQHAPTRDASGARVRTGHLSPPQVGTPLARLNSHTVTVRIKGRGAGIAGDSSSQQCARRSVGILVQGRRICITVLQAGKFAHPQKALPPFLGRLSTILTPQFTQVGRQ